MVKFEKYLTRSGKTKWRYSGYFGINSKTGNKIQPRAKGFETKAEAKLNYERRIEKLKVQSTTVEQKQIKFFRLFEEYLQYYHESGIKPGTFKKFKDEMERYALPYLKNYYIDKITVNDCQKVYDKIRKVRKDHRKIKNQVKTILDFAVSKQYIYQNPMQFILVSKVDLHYKKRRLDSSENFYTPEQLMSFLDAFREVEEFPKFVYFRLLAFTGLRRSEALALSPNDLKRDIKAIDINKTLAEDECGHDFVSKFPKTKESQNLVYLDDETFSLLDELIKNQNNYDSYGQTVTYIHKSDYIFPSPKTGKFYHRQAPNDWLKNFFDRNQESLEKRGLHRISPHGFRHSQATLLYELDINPKDAQYRLRHKNLKTTMDIYTHLSEQKKRAPIKKLDNFSKGATLGATFDEQEKETP